MPSYVCRSVLAAAVGLWPALARAEDWRFCLGASFADHRAFISDVFDNAADRPSLEAYFDKLLADDGLRHEFVQCPLAGDKVQAVEARLNAEEFDRLLGLSVVTVASGLVRDN